MKLLRAIARRRRRKHSHPFYVTALDGKVHASTHENQPFPKTLCGRAAYALDTRKVDPKKNRCKTCNRMMGGNW